jgi:hypothetical protein
MLTPLIERPRRQIPRQSRERGVTMAFVALCIVAIISMAALSIDIGTLYEAKAEAQRAADLAVLTAARIISIEGITGDPTKGPSDGSWNDICGSPTSPASLAAIGVAQKNLINGAAPSTINVYYGTDAGVGTATSCTGAGPGFTINPVIQVYVQQANLPTFFARVFSLVSGGSFANSGVSATATAEVFNSSGTGSLPSGMVPVQPRCVKPWIVPNVDPGNASNPFLNPDGTIFNGGISQLGGGVIGETFNLKADCGTTINKCSPVPPPRVVGGALQYIPATTSGAPIAVASNTSCSLTNNYQSEIAGCDQSTNYACGTPAAVTPDLTENPEYPSPATGDTATAIQCLTNSNVGQDALAGYAPPSTPPTYPFEITAGFGNPLVQAGAVESSDIITVSNNIVTIPIYDSKPGVPVPPQVTILGFLQVFINSDIAGSPSVTVMNITGCSNSAAGNPTVSGTSPVPIRLITAP